MGAWSIDTLALKTTLSDFVRDMLGILPEQEATMELILSAIKPEYHEMLTQTLKNAVENGIPSDSEYAIVNLQTGEEKWVKATATVLFDSQGKPAKYTGIFMDITKSKLDELRKNDFIGMVSHGLKTPLTSLTAIVQVANLKLKNSGDAFLAGAMEKASVQVKRMSNMINGFLNVSRLESAKLIIEQKKFDLEELIEETIKETELTISSHNFHYLPCHPVIIDADRDKIGSVITNLISNAIKYSPKGKEINIKCEVSGKLAQVSISDEGMGLAPSDQEKSLNAIIGWNQVARSISLVSASAYN